MLAQRVLTLHILVEARCYYARNSLKVLLCTFYNFLEHSTHQKRDALTKTMAAVTH